MKSFNDFLEESGDAASRAASFRGQAQGGSGTMGTNKKMGYHKWKLPDLPAGKKKEEPKKAPEKKPAQKPTQKALPAGKERKALPAAKERKQIAGSERKQLSGSSAKKQVTGSSANKPVSAAPERKKIAPSPQKKSIAGGSSSIVKRTSSSLARSA